MLVAAAAFVWGAALVAMIRPAAAHQKHEPEDAPIGFLRESGAGFLAIVRDQRLRVVVGLYAAQTLLAGALTVLVVVTALDLLNKGNSTVGLLNAAMRLGRAWRVGLLVSLVAWTHGSPSRHPTTPAASPR